MPEKAPAVEITDEWLAGSTPTVLDTEQARLDDAAFEAIMAITHVMGSIHYAAGDKKNRDGRYLWTTPLGKESTDQDARAEARRRLEAKTVPLYEVTGLERDLAGFEDHRDEWRRLTRMSNRIGAEFRIRGGWTRYRLVTSSPNGHVHDFGCGSYRYDTRSVLLPRLSGTSYEAAVREMGPMMCSRCWPDAPVETHALGGRQGVKCAGSAVPATESRTLGGRAWSKCPTCKRWVNVVEKGLIRTHRTRPTST